MQLEYICLSNQLKRADFPLPFEVNTEALQFIREAVLFKLQISTDLINIFHSVTSLLMDLDAQAGKILKLSGLFYLWKIK